MEWKEIRLGDVCSKIGSGATPSGGKEAYKGGNYHLIRSQNVLDFTFNKNGLVEINDEQANKLKNVEINNGDVLLNITGDSVARCCIVPSEILPARVNQHVAIIRAKAEELDNRYLLYRLQFSKRHLMQIASAGATRNAITKTMIENYILSCPKDISDQRRIASLLSSLDRKIELNNKINAQLEEMALAIFKSWFVDFEPFKDGKFVESELGMIPEGWKVGTLFDIAEIFDKKRKPLSGNKRENMKKVYPYYGATSCMDYVDDYIFDGIYTLIGEDGSVVKDNGFPYMQYVWGKIWVNNHAHILQGKNGFSTEMIHVLLSKTNIKFLVTGAVQAKLSQGNMQKILVVIPPMTILKKIRPLIDDSYKKIRIATEENSRLTALRDALLPRLMSGEIEIPE